MAKKKKKIRINVTIKYYLFSKKFSLPIKEAQHKICAMELRNTAITPIHLKAVNLNLILEQIYGIKSPVLQQK